MTHFPSRRATAAALASLAVLTFAACSSSGSSKASSTTTAATSPPAAGTTATTAPAATAPPDPCSLVSKAQAEKVVSVTLQPAVKAGSGDDVLCQYTSAPTGPTAQVEVFVGAGAKKNLDIDKDNLGHAFTKLTGVGDEAWLEADNVFLRKGTVWVGVNVVALDAPPAQVQTQLTALAKTIAGEL